jgi:hypothetical protein
MKDDVFMGHTERKEGNHFPFVLVSLDRRIRCDFSIFLNMYVVESLNTSAGTWNCIAHRRLLPLKYGKR